MFGLGHLDIGPLFYGLVLAITVFSVIGKFKRGRYLALAVEVATFYVVFNLHKGSMTGGMSASIAALIVGTVFDFQTRRK